MPVREVSAAPRDPRRPLLTLALAMRTNLVSPMMAAGAFWLLNWLMKMAGGTIAEARTAVINGIVVIENAYLFTYAPVMNRFLDTAPIESESWLRILRW